MVAANSINESTTGITGFTGTAFVGSPVTQYNVQTGAATSSALNQVAPSVTSGVPLISQGNAAQPIFGTAVVAGGGTGATTLTGYLVGNGTSAVTGLGTGVVNGVAITSAAGVAELLANSATPGFVLTANGATPPSWQATGASGGFTITNIQTFTTTGTYTPSANMKYCIVEVLGGGAGGGGCASTGAGTVSCGGGGGAGGYARVSLSAAQIGASKAVTIGAGGAGGAAGNNSGINGGTTNMTTLISATGGIAGAGNGASASTYAAGGSGGFGTIGDLLVLTGSGGGGIGVGATPSFVLSGFGAQSIYGNGGPSVGFSGGASFHNGNDATSYGSGGAGGYSLVTGTGAAGGSGTPGIIIVTEYI